MILVPFSGSASCDDPELSYLIDGNTGNVTITTPRVDSIVPSSIQSWLVAGNGVSGVTSALLSVLGSVTPGVSDARAMRATFLEGSCSPGDKYKGDTPETAALAGTARPKGGMHFLHSVPRATRARLRYAVRFPTGFDWRGGGKMPGLCSISWDASGGVTDPAIAGVTSWTSRLMWRPDGEITPYCYMADNRDVRWNGSAYSSVFTGGNGNPTFSGSGLFATPKFVATNVWIPLEQELWMNDVGQVNGGMKLTVDGEVVLNRSDLIWRRNDRLFIDSIFMSSFFGGNTFTAGDGSVWPTLVETTVDFSDMVYEVIT